MPCATQRLVVCSNQDLEQSWVLNEGSKCHSSIGDTAAMPRLPSAGAVLRARSLRHLGAHVLSHDAPYQRMALQVGANEVAEQLLLVNAALAYILRLPFTMVLVLVASASLLAFANVEAFFVALGHFGKPLPCGALLCDSLNQLRTVVFLSKPICSLVRPAVTSKVSVPANIQAIALSEVLVELLAAQSTTFILRWGAATHILKEPAPAVVVLVLMPPLSLSLLLTACRGSKKEGK
mmetsp:Transcript_41604/g.97599  ORF Transcript_41604/g.97599 Transcript_41604/m.97599 type:complete len:236 (-) Transcript_41604:125-832(-)